MSAPPCLDAEERELLQEIMNIAFGKAAADLAEVIDIFVVLSVPDVRILSSEELGGYLLDCLGNLERISLVEQEFGGDFKGSSHLVLPLGAAKELVALLENAAEAEPMDISAEVLERETLMEVGNILAGACIGKLAELLDTVVTYNPPQVELDGLARTTMPQELFPPGSSAIVLKTLFRFNGRNVEGFLFLLLNQASFAWLRKALAEFLGRYA